MAISVPPGVARWWTEAVLAQALPVTPADSRQSSVIYRRSNGPAALDWIDPLHDIEAEELAVPTTSRAGPK